MDLTGIREALHQRSFEPFSIRLTDGRSLPVPQPDFLAVGVRRLVVLSQDDSWSVVEPLLVVSLEFNGARSSPQ